LGESLLFFEIKTSEILSFLLIFFLLLKKKKKK